MTFQDIQNDVADRLNLTSSQALARIGREINQRYKWVASAIGLHSTARVIALANTVVGDRHVIFPAVAKIYSVFNPSPTPPVRLNELHFDLLRNKSQGSDPPIEYAVQTMGATTVTIFLGCTPATVYPLQADAEATLPTLTGDAVPSFSEDYHDLLVSGVMANELEKMEKQELAKLQEGRFDRRLDELRLFLGLKS